MAVRLERVESALPDQMQELRAEADAEGVRNQGMLECDFASGTERFSKPGEILLAAFGGDTLVAIGGLTVEPDQSLRAMRLRRVFVRKAWRGRGIGRLLGEALMKHGFESVDLLTLNAAVPGAPAFWEALGFSRVAHTTRTHEMRRSSYLSSVSVRTKSRIPS
jgi:GNAT superfamily N-acetyltransferase